MLRNVFWLVVPGILTVVAVVFPPAALVPVGILATLYIFTRPRDQVRGSGVGMALVTLAFIGSNSAPSTLRVVAVVLATLIVVVTAALAERRHVARGSAVPAFLAYIGYAVFISLATLSSSIATIAAALGAVVVIALVVRKFSSRDFVAMVRWVVPAAIAQVMIAFAELFLLAEPIWGYRNLTSAGVPVLRFNPFLADTVLRAQGTFGHPIPFALFFLFTFFLCLAPVLKSHGFLRIAGITAGLAGLFLSGTRSAALAGLVALVYFLISSRGIQAKTRNVALISAVVVTVMIGDFGIRGVIFDLLASDSLAHRVDGWTLATGLLGRGMATVLFGTGLNSEGATFAAGYLQQDGFNVIDNQWLTLFVTTGLIGLTLFFIAVLVGWLRAGRPGRALILAISVMFFSFDVTTWPTSFVLLAFAIALPREATLSATDDADESARATAAASVSRRPRTELDPPFRHQV